MGLLISHLTGAPSLFVPGLACLHSQEEAFVDYRELAQLERSILS